jgi:hypothetical protein
MMWLTCLAPIASRFLNSIPPAFVHPPSTASAATQSQIRKFLIGAFIFNDARHDSHGASV